MKEVQCKNVQDSIIEHITDMATLLKQHIDFNNESPLFLMQEISF